MSTLLCSHGKVLVVDWGLQVWLLSVDQELTPYRTELVPAGSRMDSPLTKSEAVSDVESSSVITYLRRGKKHCEATVGQE